MSWRRKISAVVLGIVYGNSLWAGSSMGLGFVFKDKNYLDNLGSHDPIVLVLEMLRVTLSALLAAYVGRSAWLGVVSGLLSLALPFTIALMVPHERTLFGLPGLYLLTFIVAVGAARVGGSVPVMEGDIENGRVVGIRWPHWLWLWLAWNTVIANTVWLGVPLVMMAGSKMTVIGLVRDTFASLCALGMLAFGAAKTLDVLRHNSPTHGWKRVGLFLFWLLVWPMLANLMRSAVWT